MPALKSLLLLWGALVGRSCGQGGTGGLEAGGAIIPPAYVFDPNTPGCANSFGLAMEHSVEGTTRVVRATVLCARERGWYGQTIFGNKKVYPFHNDRRCAESIFRIISEYAETARDIFDAMATCFQIDQGCAQSISGTLENFMEALEALMGATLACAPPGADPPYFSNDDIPVRGFICWERVERIVERLLVSARYIDSAIESCPKDAGSYGLTTPPPPDIVPEERVDKRIIRDPNWQGVLGEANDEALGVAPHMAAEDVLLLRGPPKATTAPDATKAFLSNVLDRSGAAAWIHDASFMAGDFSNSRPASE